MTLTVSAVHSCVTCYENLLHFTESLQPSEGSRGDTYVDRSAASGLRGATPECSVIMHSRPLCLPSLHMQTTAGCYRRSTQLHTHWPVRHKSISARHWITGAHWSCVSAVHVLFVKSVTLNAAVSHATTPPQPPPDDFLCYVTTVPPLLAQPQEVSLSHYFQYLNNWTMLSFSWWGQLCDLSTFHRIDFLMKLNTAHLWVCFISL